MENQGDHVELDAHPASSSSSSSPPSSPSSSSSASSSSSPSRPQSFASSRSSQKELSVPSSSGSSSTSSSPFSGPSSPLRTAVDQVASNSSEESNRHVPTENGTLFSTDTSILPNSSAAVSAGASTSNHLSTDLISCELQVIEAFAFNANGLESTDTEPELFNLSRTAGSENDTIGSTTEEVTHVNDDDQTLAKNLITTIQEDPHSGQVTQQTSKAHDEPLMSPNVEQNEFSADVDCHIDGKCAYDSHQLAVDVSDCTGLSSSQNTILAGKKHTQLNKDNRIVSSRDNSPPEKNSNIASCTDDVNASNNGDNSNDTPYAEGHPETSFSTIVVELGANVSFEVKCSVEESSKNTVVPLGAAAATFLGEETTELPSDIKALSDQSEIFENKPADITGLPRAKTMPSGFLEVVNGEVRPSSHSTFKRSSTEKSKARSDITQTPGPKMSKRKQKKLLKRMFTVQKDGTVELDLDRSTRFPHGIYASDEREDNYSTAVDEDESKAIPPLEIAMLIVGTRGDVQPFVAIGKRLQEHGHRVRLATHANFEDFVLKAGLEFYPLGGDPKVLAGYMVKNKGFLPSGPSEIRTQKKQLKSIINSLLSACTRRHGNGLQFKAQAIIANPPAYGHVHVAEFLNVPLHIFFTMPWTPTNEFPHPLSRVGHTAANRLSYQVVDYVIWLGIRGIINDFRKKKLKLRPITYLGGSQQSVTKLPTGYIWSPHLVPKPKDWGPKIDVVGFCFLNLSQDYKPPDDLVKWLAAGPAPIYVGFGSLPVEDPLGMTEIIVDALERTSQRGIINKGWGGLGNMSNYSYTFLWRSNILG
ncbi:hypothetical protein KP509_13G042700 [Ceratopteris richardii]|uniref:Glycosyltransferase family 28 N-terminal domain-containing protein n=2 Tax=Ceratopteris richardii TaxID=49495 RepID=A0A8T2TIA6_CERRI|nr:hypothetical protein KP509_13G042700 [Ceratopteris richardii]